MDMKKNLFTLAAVLCIMATAMAQTNSTVSGKHSDSIPQPNLTQMSLDSLQNEDADSCQSIMLRHRAKNASTQYHYKRAKYMMFPTEVSGNLAPFLGLPFDDRIAEVVCA